MKTVIFVRTYFSSRCIWSLSFNSLIDQAILFFSFAVAVTIGGNSLAGFETSVEVLTSDWQTWNSGPSLPYGISGAVAVQAPNGGIILVGGKWLYFLMFVTQEQCLD